LTTDKVLGLNFEEIVSCLFADYSPPEEENVEETEEPVEAEEEEADGTIESDRKSIESGRHDEVVPDSDEPETEIELERPRPKPRTVFLSDAKTNNSLEVGDKMSGLGKKRMLRGGWAPRHLA